MKKEDYIQQIQDLTYELETIKSDILLLKQKYIDSNSKFKIGDKVLITTPSRRYQVLRNDNITVTEPMSRAAFIREIDIDYQKNIRYNLFKAKKDGTISKNHDYLSSDETIELLPNLTKNRR